MAISIHKALAGLDPSPLSLIQFSKYFNPQGPRGPRRSCSSQYPSSKRFQSTRPSRASTRSCLAVTWPNAYFNPQVPRGPRLVVPSGMTIPALISIHKALAGLDVNGITSHLHAPYFNPQGPRGPRPLCISVSPRAGISIHKALAGLDAFCSPLTDIWSLFQSTRPSRASTVQFLSSLCQLVISIHKALAGLDEN